MTSWRHDLCKFLAAHVDVPLTLGTLFERFGSEIPLHSASRVWLANHQEVADAYKMRWRCFSVQLNSYRIEVVGGRARGRRLRRDAQIIPRAVPCMICGRPLFAIKPTLTHPGDCSKELIKLRKRATAERRKAAVTAPCHA